MLHSCTAGGGRGDSPVLDNLCCCIGRGLADLSGGILQCIIDVQGAVDGLRADMSQCPHRLAAPWNTEEHGAAEGSGARFTGKPYWQ